MSDREERGNKLAGRFEDEPDEDDVAEIEVESKTDKTAQIDETDMSDTTTQTAETGENEQTEESDKTSLKEKPSVLMYLDEDLKTELDARFDELNAKHRREHGEALEKNRDYYPAIVEAGLEGKDIEDVLDV
jgi:hypothetical protein